MIMYLPDEKFREIERLVPLASFNIIIMDEEGRILLMKRTNEPAKGLYWYPGGRIKRGQSLEEALKEQVKEETGLSQSQVEVIKVASVDSVLFKSRHTININFLLKKKKDSEVKLDPQHSDFKWLKPEEFDKEKLDPYLTWVLKGEWRSFVFNF